MSSSNYKISGHCNWEGDKIVFDTSIKAMRKIPEILPERRYEIDIREFLSSQNNSIMHHTLNKIASQVPADERFRFFIRQKGAFDFRALRILDYVASNISYRNRPSRDFDSWLFPDETIALGSGDCEDIAFLIASLLIASGISPYEVRVALGYVHTSGTKQFHPHAWTMYRTESGRWMLFDPLAVTAQPKKAVVAKNSRKKASAATDDTPMFQYIPHYVFNTDHLWSVDNSRSKDSTFTHFVKRQYKRQDDFWSKFNPKFSLGTHNTIFTEALVKTKLLSDVEIAAIRLNSMLIDRPVFGYHPFDHMDNGYIEEGWQRVNNRLSTGSLTDLAFALHAIADFYAHSTYGHFFQGNTPIPIFDQGLKIPNKAAVLQDVYINSEAKNNVNSLNFDHFSTNSSSAPIARSADEKNYWVSRELISGRYAQPHDNSEGFLSWGSLTHYPDDLKSPAEISHRLYLPHHDEIAVDSSQITDGHLLYDSATYASQFKKRKDAAIRHTVAATTQWKKLFSSSTL